jgi:hypothetical protein
MDEVKVARQRVIFYPKIGAWWMRSLTDFELQSNTEFSSPIRLPPSLLQNIRSRKNGP